MDYIKKIIESWNKTDNCINSNSEIFKWIQDLNKATEIEIKESTIINDTFWFYDDYRGEILNRRRSFFSIIGMREFIDGRFVQEQPVIIQPEIGYLGIICKEIEGVLYFLMQAKIEPGNINCVQISPTIQATKSNFTRAHGGKLPMYFDYFENSQKYHVIYDQIQSEQSGRFYKKRNRNMIMVVDKEIVVHPNFKWMTLGQIKSLMKHDNLVNMDTRTVLSGIPFLWGTGVYEDSFAEQLFKDKSLYNSIFKPDSLEYLPKLFQKINNYKMFSDIRHETVPLYELADWKINEYGMESLKHADFMVRFYNINISGREVQKWTQPLFKATGKATFGLLTKVQDNCRLFLVKIKPEIGTFDKVEIGPSIQWEPSHLLNNTSDKVELWFEKYMDEQKKTLVDVMLSEEGGRFYHEQNRNVIVEIDEDIKQLPQDYMWVNYSTINFLIQTNNNVNIQLRNLLSLIDM